MLSICRESLYCSTKLTRGAFASWWNIVYSSTLCNWWEVGDWIDKGMEDGIMTLLNHWDVSLSPKVNFGSMNRAPIGAVSLGLPLFKSDRGHFVWSFKSLKP